MGRDHDAANSCTTCEMLYPAIQEFMIRDYYYYYIARLGLGSTTVLPCIDTCELDALPLAWIGPAFTS